jgi:hypothetical protein
MMVRLSPQNTHHETGAKSYHSLNQNSSEAF